MPSLDTETHADVMSQGRGWRASRNLASRPDRKRPNAVWLWEMKRGMVCADCKLSFHRAAMHWGHAGSDKEINISRAVNDGWSRHRVVVEIAECELVCASCDAIRTYARKRNTDRSDYECYSYLRDVAQLG
jgi:hypothetical protein